MYIDNMKQKTASDVDDRNFSVVLSRQGWFGDRLVVTEFHDNVLRELTVNGPSQWKPRAILNAASFNVETLDLLILFYFIPLGSRFLLCCWRPSCIQRQIIRQLYAWPHVHYNTGDQPLF